MTRRVQVQTDLTTEELQERYRQSRDAVERTHWHMLWLLKEGKSPREVAEVLGYTARWVRTVVQRWNAQGEEGIRDQRHDSVGSPALLSPTFQEELRAALQQSLEDAGLWSGAIRGALDATAVRPRGGSAARMGLPPAARLQHPRASSSARQSRRSYAASV